MKSYLKTKDYSFSKEAFELRYDDNLDMLITHPQPLDLKPYYESSDYISHSDSKKSLIDKLYHLVKSYSLKKKINLVSSYTNRKGILDVGAGTGDFLIAAKKSNWIVEGVEPNMGAREKAAHKGLQLKRSLEEAPKRKYPVITLWHVLEHLPNLDDQIAQLSKLLDDDGTLFIAVPNFKSYDAGYYKEYWAAYDVPRHLWHFSKSAIETLFHKQGLKLVTTKPMIFDSFYVSLLSEKYKTGGQNYLNAFYRGLRSNIAAWSTNEYSSQIYVLKKAKNLF